MEQTNETKLSGFSILLRMINLDMLRCVQFITYSSGGSPVDRDSQHALLQGMVRHPGLKGISMKEIMFRKYTTSY